MKPKTPPKHCPESGGKFCFASEAMATRSMNKYDDIQRVYYCEHCDSYHTTSMGTDISIELGIIEEKRKITPKEIKKRLKYLINLQR